MPKYFQKIESNDGIIAIWKVTESIEQLSAQLQLRDADWERIDSYKLERRKLEFLAVRCLIKEILHINPQIDYLESGRPVLTNATYTLSISHSKDYVAVALSKHAKVGIDIEFPSQRVTKVRKRFISDKEQTFIPEEKETEYYTLIWCLKECMYKLFDKKNIIFNRHLQCSPFTMAPEGEINAHYCFDREIELKYKYLTSHEFYLVYHC